MKNKTFFVLIFIICFFAGTYTNASTPSEDMSAPVYVIPGGETVGIRLHTDGILIISDGGSDSPASKAGLKRGDIIISVNGKKVTEASQLSQIVSEGGKIEICRKRGSGSQTVYVYPKKEGGIYRLGIWVRDSTAGLGTVTFYKDGSFAALGHAVTDADTDGIMPLSEGSVAQAQVCGISRGKRGSPGELIGVFGEEVSGMITKNSEIGIYGTYPEPPEKQAIPIAVRTSVHEGSAEILADIDGSGVRAYSAEIEKISYYKDSRSIIIHITDKDLIERTGGIVQGMSGAPIIQDGCLAGAVTHVFINDPSRGYGIFSENMYYYGVK